MPRPAQNPSEQLHSEAEMLAEEIRKLRESSPWEALIPLSIGAGFALVLLIAGMLIVRSL
ncbi:hypothetical protein N805_01095 [Pseudomonas putida S13.1.2]|uniref:Uncharacterized protein n=1 Tax=Pseudomonas putida S13.1.2 TaxID=1384061 RepID=A0AAU8RQH1_PSEPU|nr:hypothetical protein N805_01095 [Pseudomonas putida S13.1.2]